GLSSGLRLDAAVAQPPETGAIGPYPERSLRVLPERQHVVVGERVHRAVGRERAPFDGVGREASAGPEVETSRVGADPGAALSIFVDDPHGVVREAIRGTQRSKAGAVAEADPAVVCSHP